MNRWLIAAGAVAAGWGAIEGAKRLAFVVAVPVALAFASAGDVHGVALAAWAALVALYTMTGPGVRPYLLAVALLGMGATGFALWPREPGPTVEQVQAELATAHGALAAARAQHEQELEEARAQHVEVLTVLVAEAQAQAREERAKLQAQHREELAQARSELAQERSKPPVTRVEHVDREVVRYVPASQAPSASNHELCAALAKARKEHLSRIGRGILAHSSLQDTEARMRAAGCSAIG